MIAQWKIFFYVHVVHLLAYTCYTLRMEVPITKFRRQIFSLVEQAQSGTEVWVTHKGQRVRLVPEKPASSRLSRITPMQIVNTTEGVMDDDSLLAEMTRSWEADWERDFGPAPDGVSSANKSGVEP